MNWVWRIIGLWMCVAHLSLSAQNPYNGYWSKESASDTQNTTNSGDSSVSSQIGETKEVSSALFKKVLAYKKNWNDSISTSKGYRVQIYAVSGPDSKAKAYKKKDEFETYFSDTKAHLVSAMPYFKIRVGDFKTRLAALGFLEQVKAYYPNAFVVYDQISIK